jgi:cytoskeletal protein RodZ
MKTRTIVYALIVALVAVGLVFVGLKHNTTVFSQNSPNHTSTINPTNTSQTNSSQNNTSNSNSSVLFADTQYAPYSYLISSSPLSQDAQAALTGYNLSITDLANGTRSVALYVNGTTRGGTFNLAKDYKLYIIETSFGDDSFGHDSSLADDAFAIVDSSGHLVNMFAV